MVNGIIFHFSPVAKSDMSDFGASMSDFAPPNWLMVKEAKAPARSRNP